MSNLDNLTSKILNDAKIKADEIVKAAQKMAAEKSKKEIGKYNFKKHHWRKVQLEIEI